MSGTDIHLLSCEEWSAIGLVAIEVTSRGMTARISEVDVTRVGRDVNLVG